MQSLIIQKKKKFSQVQFFSNEKKKNKVEFFSQNFMIIAFKQLNGVRSENT